MFSKPLLETKKFTTPIFFITKFYDITTIAKGSAAMFFVNEMGCAITCKHVALDLYNSQKIREQYLEKKKNNTLKKGDIVDKSFVFPNTFQKFEKIKFILHPKYDIAIIKFENISNKIYQSYAYFPKENKPLDQGTSICKVGFPYAEFSNYGYDSEKEKVYFKQDESFSYQQFPLDGIITRNLHDNNKEIFGFESSTPGLKGQSGGPIINRDGLVLGIQSLTRHLHLGFDIENYPIKKNNSTKHISNYQFINLGVGVDYKIIKKFLDDNNIKYYQK